MKPPGPLLSLRSLRSTQTKHRDSEDFWVQSSIICHRRTPKLKAVHKDGWVGSRWACEDAFISSDSEQHWLTRALVTLAAQKLLGIKPLLPMSASFNAGPAVAPTMAWVPVGLAHLHRHSLLPGPPPWLGILPSAVTAVPQSCQNSVVLGQLQTYCFLDLT